ncbi:hypothetical protein V8B97DRAFT_1918047 [Scleroderma yunnanense]
MLRTSCKGLKVCSQHGTDILEIMHSFKVVFDKMLAFFLILHQQGCSFCVSGEATQEDNYHLDEGIGLDSDSDSVSDSDSDLNSGFDMDIDIDHISDIDMDSLSVHSMDSSHLGLHADFDSILQHFGKAQQCQQSPHAALCSGRVILKQDCFNRHFVQCEYRNRHNQ